MIHEGGAFSASAGRVISGLTVAFALGGAPHGLTIQRFRSHHLGDSGCRQLFHNGHGAGHSDGLSSSGVYTVTISTPQPPVVSSATINGNAATALSFAVSFNATHAVSYLLSAAPSGMVVSGAGIVSWGSPVVGTYPVTVKVTDTTTSLTGSGVYTIVIAAPLPPIRSVGLYQWNGRRVIVLQPACVGSRSW